MDKLTTPVAFSFQIYSRKLLKTLYLFASPDAVNLIANVSVTEKTRHFSARSSQDRNWRRFFCSLRKLCVALRPCGPVTFLEPFTAKTQSDAEFTQRIVET